MEMEMEREMEREKHHTGVCSAVNKNAEKCGSFTLFFAYSRYSVCMPTGSSNPTCFAVFEIA